MKQTFAIGIGGAAGQGVATPGDIISGDHTHNLVAVLQFGSKALGGSARNLLRI